MQGAIAAYRKAKELDPKDKDSRNLAMLLEYDSNGDRYTAKAQLKDAISEFKDLKKLDRKQVIRMTILCFTISGIRGTSRR